MDKRIWKLIDTCICITESLCCTPETNNIVNQLCSKKKKRRLEACCLERADWVLVSGWRTKQGKDQSRGALGVCRKGEGHYGVSWDLSKPGKGARTSITQEGQESQQKNWVPAFAPQTCAPIIRWWQPIWFCVCSWHWLCQAAAGSWLDETVTRREGLTYSMWEGGV